MRFDAAKNVPLFGAQRARCRRVFVSTCAARPASRVSISLATEDGRQTRDGLLDKLARESWMTQIFLRCCGNFLFEAQFEKIRQ